MTDRASPSVMDRPLSVADAARRDRTRRDGDTGTDSTSLAAAAGARSRLGVLRHRDFFWVWVGAMGSSIGTWMESVGVQWVMTQRTTAPEWIAAGRPSANLMLGYLSACLLLPMLFLGLAGGVAADRVNRKALLLVTQFMLMLIAGALCAASFLGHASPAVLLGLSVLQGSVMAFNVPAWQVLTPRLVPREELHRAINLNSVQFNIARVVGPALAGVLMAMRGPTVLFAVNFLSFLGILAAVARTPDAPAPSRAGASARHEVLEAVRFVFHNKGPCRVFLGLVVFSLCAAPLLRMLSLVVSRVYHAEEAAYGTMLSAMGVGAVLGGIALKFVPAWYPRHHLIPASLLGGGVSMVLFAASPTFAWGSLFMLFSGVFWLWSFSVSITALQLLVSDEMRGRVMAVSNTAVFGAMPIGSVLAGWIGDLAEAHAPASVADPKALGVQAGIGVMALVLTAASAVMLTWRTPEIDELGPGDGGRRRIPGFWRGLTAGSHRPARARRDAENPAQEPPAVV